MTDKEITITHKECGGVMNITYVAKFNYPYPESEVEFTCAKCKKSITLRG